MNTPSDSETNALTITLISDTPSPVMEVDTGAILSGGRRRVRRNRMIGALGAGSTLAVAATVTALMWPNPAATQGVPGGSASPTTSSSSSASTTSTLPTPPVTAAPNTFFASATPGEIIVPAWADRPEQRFRIEQQGSDMALFTWRGGKWQQALWSDDGAKLPGVTSYAAYDATLIHLIEVPADTTAAWEVTTTPVPANYWAAGTRLGGKSYALVSASQPLPAGNNTPPDPGADGTIRDVIWVTDQQIWGSLSGDTGLTVTLPDKGLAVIYPKADIWAYADCPTPGNPPDPGSCTATADRASKGYMEISGVAPAGVPAPHVAIALLPSSATDINPVWMPDVTPRPMESFLVPGTTLRLIYLSGTTPHENDPFVAKVTYLNAAGFTHTLTTFDNTQRIDLTP